MSADLSQVQPGWRGTDPDGGTWVRLASAAPWLEVTADGGVHWRLQEEAEAAGLVPLPAPAEPGQFWVLVGGKSPAAAPAPLDPGNPEHLRQVADVLDSVGRLETARWIRSEADRLDRERAEAGQDAADRKLAEQIARETFDANTHSGPDELAPWEEQPPHCHERFIAHVLAGIRAGRADRGEEAK